MNTCPICGSAHFAVESTWTVKNGDIHRRRICAVCEQWGFISVESPQSPTNGKVAETGSEAVYTTPLAPEPSKRNTTRKKS